MSWLPDCGDMSRLLSESREAGGALSLSARLHLLICEACRRVRLQFEAVARAARSAPEDGPSLSPGAKERLRRALFGG
jgi:hypothetical protein